MDNLTEELRSYGQNLFRVSVEATASPEGNYEHNMRLAQRRAAKALSIISTNLGSSARDVQLPLPKVRVCTWDELVVEMERSVADTTIVGMVRNVVANNEQRNIYGLLVGLPFYESTIAPALSRLRSMTCSYTVETNRPLTASEAVAKYFAGKADYISGKKNFGADFSDGDLYNLYSTIRDTSELDTVTDLAYKELIKRKSYELYKFAPYLANRKALLNLKRGVPDLEVLRPFLVLDDNRIPIKNPNERLAGKNYREMIVNQAIAYFQEQSLDSARSMVNWVMSARPSGDGRDSTLSKLELFITFQDYFSKYFDNTCTPEQRDSFEAAYNFVVEENLVNKAIIYTEMRNRLGVSREEAEGYVDMMDDGNAKKWYLKGMLWSGEAGQEPPVGLGGQFRQLSDAELAELRANDYQAYLRYIDEETRYNSMLADSRGDKTPYFLAYFQHSFDLQPDYRRLYASEGNVKDDIRKKYPYIDEKADTYRRKFDVLYAATKKASAPKAKADANPTAEGGEAAPAADGAAAPSGEANTAAEGGEAAATGRADTNGNETK